MKFTPDYNNFVIAAGNGRPDRLPLYEHGVDLSHMERLTGRKFPKSLFQENADSQSIKEGMDIWCRFWQKAGYDVVVWEIGVTSILPGNGALGAHQPGCMNVMQDLQDYPWDELCKKYFDRWGPYFDVLREVMPAGMKAFGGPGNGVFECVQDITGFEKLCLISIDDPDMYAGLFEKCGSLCSEIWGRFLSEYSDVFAAMRFGDDLGYKSATLLSSNDVRKHIIPQYKKVVDQVHDKGFPFILHSCGNIFSVMEDIIDVCKIDGKHSNEDAIAPFDVWVDKYGDRISNCGGVDVNVLSHGTEDEIISYTKRLYDKFSEYNGILIGSGNSIPAYVPFENYMTMINTVRSCRGDF
jgi:uroporphyrinogen decarboxylase